MDGNLELSRHDAHVLVRGELHLVGEVACDRCRDPILVSLGGDVSIVYSPVNTLPETVEDELGLPKSPVDVGFAVEDVGEFDGVALNLADVVREWATIERPTRLMCGDMAEQADPACMARYQALSGTSAFPSGDLRFAILSAFKPKSED